MRHAKLEPVHTSVDIDQEPRGTKRYHVDTKLETQIKLFLVKQTVRGETGEPTAAQVAGKAAKLIKDIVESNTKNILELSNILQTHTKFYED